MRCECGQTKVNGKCPVCDSAALSRPSWRAQATAQRLKKREQQANGCLGLSIEQSRQGFYRFAAKAGIKVYRGKRRKRA